jgi:phospholipase C
MTRCRVAALALLLCLAPLAWAPAASGAERTGGQGRPAHQPRTPIRHLITLMQENHSFDNYFGSFPGADGPPTDACMPADLTDPAQGCVKPFHLAKRPITDLGHSREVFERQYRVGRMDGFVSAYRHEGLNGENAMGYYDDRDLPYYWNVADRYVLFDRFFTSAAAGSVWNHMFWVTGTPGNFQADLVPKGGFKDLPTIFDRLEEAGVSWKFYVQNYDPTINLRTANNPSKGDRVSQVIWVPPLLYARFLDNPKLSSHIVDLDEYFRDLRQGTLPAVSYVVPSGASEHPPGSIQAGERFVRGLLNALAASSAWSSSAFTWTYDDWGGWYDHVKPPKVDRYGYGFRAPTLLVSAYAKPGEVVHTQLDFTSILRFVEDNWNLKPLAERDANANSIADGLDFTQPPRPAEFIPAERAPQGAAEAARRPVIYGAYGLALLFAAALLGFSGRLAEGVTGLRRFLGRHPGTST